MDLAIKIYLFIPTIVAIGMSIFAGLLPAAMHPNGERIKSADLPNVLIVGAIAAVLHTGYFLGPWWYGTPREVWAAAMMAPLAVAAIVVILSSTGMRRAIFGLRDGRSNRSVKYYLRYVVGLVVIYVLPPVVVLAG